MIERRDEEKRLQAGVPFWSNATLGLEGGIIAPQRTGRAGYFGEDKIRKGEKAARGSRDSGGQGGSKPPKTSGWGRALPDAEEWNTRCRSGIRQREVEGQ